MAPDMGGPTNAPNATIDTAVPTLRPTSALSPNVTSGVLTRATLAPDAILEIVVIDQGESNDRKTLFTHRQLRLRLRILATEQKATHTLIKRRLLSPES
jgi:hypothetical protein